MTETREKIIKAALALASEKNWSAVGMSDIAAQAQLDLSVLHAHFEDKDEILRVYGRRLDTQVMEAFQGQELEGDSTKDKLFDILMERFDLMYDDRDAVLSIMKAYKFDPKRAAIALPHVAKSMSWMLELAGQSCDNWRGCIKILGLTGIYLDIAMRVWPQDESPDMPKTMAALDKALGRAESMANSMAF